MQIPLIVGNWKMHKTASEALELVTFLRQQLMPTTNNKYNAVILPPYTALKTVADYLKDSSIKVGSQDLFWEDSGAFTGAISGAMLHDAGATYVLVGHSERRQLFGETDIIVKDKLGAALRHNLIPILCVGETLAEREAHMVNEIITKQLTTCLDELTQDASSTIIIAYEPIWAIGTGKTATPEQAAEVHSLIRKVLAQKFGKAANSIYILYGGSVKAENTKELLSQPNIDGVLVGGASLKAEDFLGIITKTFEVDNA